MKNKTTKSRLGTATRTGERGLPIWPRGKPLPEFTSESEEAAWWHTYDREPPDEDSWEQVVYEPQVTRRARSHVYRVRFDDLEMGILQTLAKRRGVHVSVILRELVRERGRVARMRGASKGFDSRMQHQKSR
jgi:hypothetical protein